MIVTRLRSNNEDEMFKSLRSSLLINEDGDLITSTRQYWVHIIGNIESKSGYHANFISNKYSLIKSLSGITINVKNPLVKIAGER